MSHALPTIETSVAERMFGNFIGRWLPGILAVTMVVVLMVQFYLGYEFTIVTALVSIVFLLGTDMIRGTAAAIEKRRVRALARDPGTLSLAGDERYPGHRLPIVFFFPALRIGRMWTELRMLPEMEEWCRANLRGQVLVLPMPTADIAKNGVRTLKVWFEDTAERDAFARQFAEHLS